MQRKIKRGRKRKRTIKRKKKEVEEDEITQLECAAESKILRSTKYKLQLLSTKFQTF